MAGPSVLQVCVFAGSGGVEHHVLALSRHLGPVARPVVVAPTGSWLAEAAVRAGVPIRTVPEPRGNFDLRTLMALRGVIRDVKPEIVHSHLGRSDWYSWLALFGARQVKLVTTEHGISENRQDLFVTGVRRMLHEWAHGLRFRRTDALIAVSASTARTLRKRYPILANRDIAVIAPGIDAERLFRIERPMRAPEEPLHVTVVSRLSEEKGVDVALQGFRELLAGGVAATLRVVGSGPESNRLRESVREPEIKAAVQFTGFLEDVTDELVASDVLLLTSHSENLPIALLEGMASGLPVIGTRVGGIPEIVTDGVEGFLVTPGDSHAVAEALCTLATDVARRRAMGESARAAARGYDIAHTVSSIGRVYESLR